MQGEKHLTVVIIVVIYKGKRKSNHVSNIVRVSMIFGSKCRFRTAKRAAQKN